MPGLQLFHDTTKEEAGNSSAVRVILNLFCCNHAFQPGVNGRVGGWVAHVKQSWKESEKVGDQHQSSASRAVFASPAFI